MRMAAMTFFKVFFSIFPTLDKWSGSYFFIILEEEKKLGDCPHNVKTVHRLEVTVLPE